MIRILAILLFSLVSSIPAAAQDSSRKREDQIEFTNIGTTRKLCPKPRMTSEEAFLTTLKSAQRWRIDDKGRLIVEGEAARLLLTAAAGDKPSPKK